MSFALLAALALAQDARVEEAGNLRFVRPKDWTRATTQGAVWLIPPDVPNGRQCGLMLLPGEELKKKPQEWLDEAWKALVGDAKVTLEETATQKGDGFDVVARSAVLEKKSGGTLCVALAVFTPGTRVESVLYLADGRDLYEKHLPAVAKFIQEIGFGNVKKKPPVSARVEGAWLRGSFKLDPTGGPGSTRFAKDFLFFHADGVTCRTWNSDGIDGLDVSKQGGAADRWGEWGKRTEKDGEIRVTWSNGHESVYKRKGERLQEGTEPDYLPLPPCDSLALDGLYRAGDGKKAEQGLRDFEIRFAPDGTFEESGVCSHAMREGPAGGRGKYRIANYTLHLEYAGGAKVRMGFYVLDKPDAKMESVYLNTFIFSRAK